MAGRPPKKNLDYAGWDVDIFDNDTKIDKLLDAQSWVGFGVYFYLCQRAYGSDGYFYRWSYDDCATTARKMGGGIGSGTVRETVGYCLQIGLFDKGLFDRWEILTSRGIQRKYWIAIKDRSVKRVIADYWLLQKNECEGLLSEPINTNSHPVNVNLSDDNANNPPENTDCLDIKKSEDKEQEKKPNKKEAEKLFNDLCELYQNKRGKSSVSDKKKLELLKVGREQMARCIDRYKSYLKQNESWLKPKNCSTFFNSGYKDYLDSVYGGDDKNESGSSVTANERGLSQEAIDAGIRTDDFSGF